MCPQHVIRSHDQATVVVPSMCPQHPIKSHNQATVVIPSMSPQHMMKSHNQATVVVPSMCPQDTIKSHNQATVVIPSTSPQHMMKSHNQAAVVVPSMCPQHMMKSHNQAAVVVPSMCSQHMMKSHNQATVVVPSMCPQHMMKSQSSRSSCSINVSTVHNQLTQSEKNHAIKPHQWLNQTQPWTVCVHYMRPSPMISLILSQLGSSNPHPISTPSHPRNPSWTTAHLQPPWQPMATLGPSQPPRGRRSKCVFLWHRAGPDAPETQPREGFSETSAPDTGKSSVNFKGQCQSAFTLKSVFWCWISVFLQ